MTDLTTLPAHPDQADPTDQADLAAVAARPEQPDLAAPGPLLDALDAYGNALRGDWASIDGRSEQIGLNNLTSLYRNGANPTYEQLCIELGVCPKTRQWPSHCPTGSYVGCAHTLHGAGR